MKWLRKMRRAWLAVFSSFRGRKSAGGNRSSSTSTCRGSSGLVKLKDDVEMCGYEDVQIMWDLLSRSSTTQTCQTTSDCIPHDHPKQKLATDKCSPNLAPLRVEPLLWTLH